MCALAMTMNRMTHDACIVLRTPTKIPYARLCACGIMVAPGPSARPALQMPARYECVNAHQSLIKH